MPNKIINNSAIAVANFFIKKNHVDKNELTHLKIQKLLYFAQGWFLANFDRPLFEDSIESWKYGPVVPSVYSALHDKKDQQIFDLIHDYIYVENEINLVEVTPTIILIDTSEIDFMDIFWNKYSKISTWTLVSASHKKGSPWYQVFTAYKNHDSYSNIIPVGLMRDYFKTEMEKYINAQR